MLATSSVIDNYNNSYNEIIISNKIKKDGTPKIICSHNKKRGQKSEVYPFEVEDMKKLTEYFKEHDMWLYYLMFVLSNNMARRIGDMLSLRWINFYNPMTKNFRQDILEICEDKTDKLANPRINTACKNAINLYIEKTDCNVSENNYNEYVFKQLSGNYAGRVLSDSGYLKTLKRAAKEVGIEYNVGTHSSRKTFGMLARMLHPGDYDSMELLQSIYNHNDTKTTRHYIGLTKKKVDAYYDDMGNFFDDYVVGGKEYKAVAEKPIVSLDTNDLRDIIRAAYEAGRNNADNQDAMVHVDAINDILTMIDNFAK